MASSIEISLFFTWASISFPALCFDESMCPLIMLAFNASSSLQNILPLDLQNGSISLYSLIFDSIGTFFTTVDGFWVALPGPQISLFLLLFVVTTQLRARTESCELRIRNRLKAFLSRFLSLLGSELKGRDSELEDLEAMLHSQNYKLGEPGIK